MPGSICILASDSPQSGALIKALARELPVAAVIIEAGSAQRSLNLLRFRLKRLGLTKVLGQLLFIAYDRMLIKEASKSAIGTILRSFSDASMALPWHTVRSVNSYEATSLIRRCGSTVCCVTGTSIIRNQILREVPVFLNIHCGITPAYRGVHGAFWAVHQHDLENVGVTIHKIDRGVDTGEIVAQAAVRVDPAKDTHRTLVAKQYAVGIPLMVQAARDALNGNMTTFHREDLPSQQWFGPTLSDYRRFRRIMRSLRDSAA